MMKNENKMKTWIIVILIVIALCVITGKVSAALDINMRSARYLVVAIIFFVWYIVDVIRNKTK